MWDSRSPAPSESAPALQGSDAAGQVTGDDEGEGGSEKAGEDEDRDGDLAGEAGGIVEMGARLGDEIALVLLQLGQHLLHHLLAERLGVHHHFGDGFGLVAARGSGRRSRQEALSSLKAAMKASTLAVSAPGVWLRTWRSCPAIRSRRELNWATSSAEAPPLDPASAVIWLSRVTCF